MATRRNSDSDKTQSRRRPATTPEARENQLISSAIELAERQIREGTASSQVLTHFLKLGTTREKLEQEKISRENELLRAKSEALASAADMQEIYKDAIEAMRSYQGFHDKPAEDA